MPRRRPNSDVIDQAAETGTGIANAIFSVPGVVLDRTIKTTLSAKDALKKKLKINPDYEAEMIELVKGTREVAELARIHKWAGREGSTDVQKAVELRCKQLGISIAMLRAAYPGTGWNPTDRALRYRANATPPEGEARCCLCGTKETVEVGHVDGHEENNEPHNLFWTCRSCNVRSANTMREHGIGRLTHQYNPTKGATSLGQWMTAVMAMKGQSSDMSVKDAVAMIRDTPQSKRSEFARDIWSRRRDHGTAKRGKQNPEDGAARLFEKFHGAESEEILEIVEEYHEHENLTALGTLVDIVVETCTAKEATFEFEGDDAPILCSSEDGKQLYIEGGDQSIDLKKIGMDGEEWVKDQMVIGQFALPAPGRKWNLTYRTQKKFDDFEVIDYQHDLGEPNEDEPKSARREAPTLVYDPRNEKLSIVGGQYQIKSPLFGMSPGIEN